MDQLAAYLQNGPTCGLLISRKLSYVYKIHKITASLRSAPWRGARSAQAEGEEKREQMEEIAKLPQSGDSVMLPGIDHPEDAIVILEAWYNLDDTITIVDRHGEEYNVSPNDISVVSSNSSL